MCQYCQKADAWGKKTADEQTDRKDKQTREMMMGTSMQDKEHHDDRGKQYHWKKL